MSTRKSTAKKGAKAKTPKAQKAPSADTLAQRTGDKLVAALKGVKGANGVVKLATSLAKGELKPADLVSLRDGLNEVATKLRAEEKADQARELSDLNRFVRRLERASR